MRTLPPIVITVEGSGSGWASTVIPGLRGRYGRVRSYKIRERPGGLATLANAMVVRSNSAISDTPCDDDVAFSDEGITLVASATTASHSRVLPPGAYFGKSGDKRFATYSTATGAYVYDVELVVELED